MHRKFVRCKKIGEIFVWAAIVISATPIRAIPSCDIPSVYEKQSTFLSCAFDTDISTTNKTSTVLHYPTNDSEKPVSNLVSPVPGTGHHRDNKNTPSIPAKQSCDIPSVQEKQLIYLSCSFDADISATKKIVTVLHYPANDSNNPVTVVYSALFEGNLEYFTRPGYTVLGNVTNTLRVKINSVTRDRNGKYECHVIPSTPGNVASCSFILKGEQSCDIPLVEGNQMIFLSCKFDVDISTSKKTVTVLHYPTNDPDNPVTVVYSRVFQGKLEYFTRPGFTVIGNVTNTLMLRINSPTRDHTGKYDCHIPSTLGNGASCNVFVKDTSSDVDGSMQYVKPWIIITLCSVLLLFAVGVIIAGVVLCKRITRKADDRETGSNERMIADNGSQSENNQP